MSMQGACAGLRRSDSVIWWILLSLVAFAILPSYALDYGFWDATPEELQDSFGWSGSGVAWLWFSMPLALLLRSWRGAEQAGRHRHIFDAAYAGFCALFILVSARITNHALGYSTIVLYASLGVTLTLALARLDWMGGDRFVIGSIVLITALIAVFIVFPSLAIFRPIFFDSDGQFTAWQFTEILKRRYILDVIANSLLLSSAVGLGATFFGLACAIYTARIAVRTAFLGRVFAILPTVTPPFVVGLGATLMMGRSGYLTRWMESWFGLTQTNWLYGFTGIWIAQVLAFAPMSFMILDGAVKALHPSLEEASYTLRSSRWQTFHYIFLPLLRPALANSFLVVFVQSLADFSNPLVLGGSFDVLATQIYFYIVGSQLDFASASTLGVVLLLFSLLVFCVQYLWIGKRSYVTVSGKSYRGEVQPLPVSLEWGVMMIVAFWVVFNCLLYGSIIYGSFTVNWGVDYTLTLKNFQTLFGQSLNDGAWPSLISTLTYSAIAAPLTALFGLLIAYVVVRQQFTGKKVLEFTTMLCFAVPGTVAGVSYILAFNTAPILLTSTAAIVVISMIMRNVPVGIRAGITGPGQLDKSLDEASLSLRAGSFRTVLYILLPLLRPAVLSALVYSFVRSMTTVSAIVFLVTPDTRTATAYILNRVEDGEYGLAIAYGTLLIVVMMAIILIFDALIGEARIARSKAKKTI